MKNWEYTELNVGLQEKGKKFEFVFTSTPKCKKIKSAVPKCTDCTNVRFARNSQGVYILKADFKTPTEMAIHLQRMGVPQQNMKKSIIVTYEDGTTEELSFIISIN